MPLPSRWRRADRITDRLDRIEWLFNDRLGRLERTLLLVLQQERIEMSQIDDLNAQLANMDAEVAKQTTVNESALRLMQELKTAVDNIPNAPDLSTAVAMAQAISDKLANNDQVLADGVTANTPAAPTA